MQNISGAWQIYEYLNISLSATSAVSQHGRLSTIQKFVIQEIKKSMIHFMVILVSYWALQSFLSAAKVLIEITVSFLIIQAALLK